MAVAVAVAAAEEAADLTAHLGDTDMRYLKIGCLGIIGGIVIPILVFWLMQTRGGSIAVVVIFVVIPMFTLIFLNIKNMRGGGSCSDGGGSGCGSSCGGGG